MTEQKRRHRHQRLRKTRHNTPQRRCQTRKIPWQQRDRHRQTLRHIVHRQTGRDENPQFATVGSPKADADANPFGKGVERHDEYDEDDSACIRSGKSSDSDILVLVEEGFCSDDEAEAEDYTD